ncbi:MAG TPA: bifunctional phosphoribosylaminoimidazolecarboxamide formyltransferase/IMP cyclohydrolase [Anaerolineae bacterium]|nr:bifunctional phosphoribosylaminoimidazolecarboxamide formyltransferase/IMP cyclohydrolase [Anaerolineae bacterium]
MNTKRVILSVYDKTNLLSFAQGLHDLGWELVASGGTARQLREADLPITDVAAVTNAPEMLGGRVKTLHPAIHGGILARDIDSDQADLAAQNIKMVDLVVCNLYPFQDTVAQPDVTLADAIEQIDIGGVTLLRAAAKNFARVGVICDPADYGFILATLQKDGQLNDQQRRQLAVKAFTHTRDYDTAITAYLTNIDDEPHPATLSFHLTRNQTLRYGENPHQTAALYATNPDAGPLGGQFVQGNKPLSYNNLLDLDAAWGAVSIFDQPAVVIVKHLSPCGIAVANSIAEAFTPALKSDPVSAFGGVIATNREVDDAFVTEVKKAKLFIEAIAAPSFSDSAQDWFAKKKKNCRLVAVPEIGRGGFEVRAIQGGFLVQDWDKGDPAGTEYTVVSQRQPTEDEWAAIRFGWLAVQQVKSNAIVFARPGRTVGVGCGLPSRIDAVALAGKKAGDEAQGAIMASDAFFPFPDGIEEAAKFGVTAVVQPGGSIRDDDVIAAVDDMGLAMVVTGVRHFRH